MKRACITISILSITLMLSGQKQVPKSLPVNSVSDKLISYAANSTKIEGYLGKKIDLVIEKRIKSQDEDYLVEPFRHKNETHLWQS